MTCTFFGHRKVPKEIEPILRLTLKDLIINNDVTTFYVGNNGQFDFLVRNVLKDMAKTYQIHYYVVLAYMPIESKSHFNEDFSDTILPDNIENVPKRFAICHRNKWMISKSDYVVTYVTNHIGSGAAQFKALAEKLKKPVISL